MAFPAQPSDGAKASRNGKVYVYVAADSKWRIESIAINSFTDTLTVTGNTSGGNLSTAGILSVTGNANVGNLSTAGNVTAGFFLGNGSQLTGIATGEANSISNGNSNVRVIANSNVTVSVAGNANIITITGTGANVSGTANISGNLSAGNISGRISPRVSSTTSITSPLAWNSDSFDQYAATAQAEALTISADAGTPLNGQKIIFRFKDNGTARALTFTTGATNAFRAIGVTLPTTTVLSKITYVGCIYNATDSRWDAIAVTTEA